MYKLVLVSLGILFVSIFTLLQSVRAEEIHFNNNVFTLKYSALSSVTNGYENEYFLKNENRSNWSKMVGIYYYPAVSDPIKFAMEESKRIESNETNVLLKFVKNKKTDQAAISYLQNGKNNGKDYFEYNVFKYEKHPSKGMMELRYAIRYFFTSKDEITKIGQKVREENDDYMQTLITSPTPPIVEKDINLQ